MDHRRFDALTQLLAKGGSRRAALATLLGLGFGGAAVSGEATKGKNKRKRRRRRRRRRARRQGVRVCFEGQTLVVDRVAARELVSRGGTFGRCRQPEEPGEPGSCDCPPCHECTEDAGCQPVPNGVLACDGSALRSDGCTNNEFGSTNTGICQDGSCYCGPGAVYDTESNTCECGLGGAFDCIADKKCCQIDGVCIGEVVWSCSGHCEPCDEPCPPCHLCMTGFGCQTVPDNMFACDGFPLDADGCAKRSGICADGECFCSPDAEYDLEFNLCLCPEDSAGACRNKGECCAVEKTCADFSDTSCFACCTTCEED